MNGNLKVTAVTHQAFSSGDTTAQIPVVESHVAVTDSHPHKASEHVVGVGVGAALGGTVGAVAGVATSAITGVATGLVLGGPVGGVVGLVAGAVVGGLLGSSIGEAVVPSADERYWSGVFQSEPYFMTAYGFGDYWPAYRIGIDGYAKHPGETFEDAECRLQDDYTRLRGNSRLGWMDARLAARAAWERRARELEAHGA